MSPSSSVERSAGFIFTDFIYSLIFIILMIVSLKLWQASSLCNSQSSVCLV